MKSTMYKGGAGAKNAEASQGQNISPRRILMSLLEDLSCAMILTIIVPAVCTLIPDRTDSMITGLYAVEWIIFPFIVIVRAFLWKTKYYYQYLILCISCIAACMGLSFAAGNFFFDSVLRNVCTGACGILLLLVCTDASAIRNNELKRQKAKQLNDISWIPRESLLEYPRIPVIIVFLLVYLLALITDCRVMCNIALDSAAAYLFLSVAYRYMQQSDLYLQSAGHLRNVPVRRIRRVGSIMLVFLLLIMFVFILPSFFTGGLRRYADIRDWKVEYSAGDEEIAMFQDNCDIGESLLPEDLVLGDGEIREPSPWLNAIMYICFAVFMIFFLRVLYRAFRQYLSDFQGVRENDDIITPIEDEEEEEEHRIRPLRRFFEPDTEKMRVRRKYRRTIRRYRKEKPMPYEMPSDIEEKAGIAGTPEGERLHTLYEEARYSE